MPSTFGQWLIVVLALGLGLAGWWVLRGRQNASAVPTDRSTVDGDSVDGAAVVATPAAPATVDAERPEATVEPAPATTAVLDEPAPVDGGPTPAGAVLDGHDAAPTDADRTEVEPADADAEPAVTHTEPEPGRPTAGEIPTPAPADTPAIPAPRSSTENAATTAEPDAVADEPTTGRDDEATTPDPAPAAQPGGVTDAGAAVPVAAAAPTTDSEAPDDFRRIQGIGPKLAAALQDAGIRTYRQLAELDEAALRDTVRAAGLRAAPTLATWPQQAKVLAGAQDETDRALPSTVGTGEDA